jgi:hypothetical protein
VLRIKFNGKTATFAKPENVSGHCKKTVQIDTTVVKIFNFALDNFTTDKTKIKVETSDHSKNGATPKSQTSRKIKFKKNETN